MKRTQENKDKIKKNMQLPFLVSNIAEIFDPTEEGVGEDGATTDMHAESKTKAVVIKTTTRQVF